MLRTAAPLALLALCAAAAHADVAVRLADLAPGAADGVPEVHAAVFQGRLYFRATGDGAAFDLWVYDGAHAPAVVPGGEGLDPLDPVVWQGELYFGGLGGDGQRELWRYDGATAPELAQDLRAAGSGDPRQLFPWDAAGLLCYQVATAEGVELGCWDGVNPPETWPLANGFETSLPTDFTVLGDRLLFGARWTNTVRRLYAFDGQSAPEWVTIDGTHPGNPHELTVADGLVYFWATAPGTSTFRVWSWDGTAAPPAPFGPAFGSPGAMVLWRGRPHLYLGQGAYGLWRVETGALTRLTGDSLYGGSVLDATVAGDAIYLVESTSETHLVDLHRFCGSESLPNVTTQFGALTDGVVRSRTVAFGERLYFAAFDATAGAELWSIPLANRFCDGFADADLRHWSAVAP